MVVALGLGVVAYRARRARRDASRTHTSPLDDDLRGLDEDLAVRLIVLAAHSHGRQLGEAAPPSKLVQLQKFVAQAEDSELSPSDGSLRRAAYGALTLAEADRGGHPSAWRRRAQRIGSQMADRGSTDPFPLYMAVVDATTRKVETGNFRDITRDGVVRVRRDLEAASRVLCLQSDSVDQHRSFIFRAP